jgi:hypothetical protein
VKLLDERPEDRALRLDAFSVPPVVERLWTPEGCRVDRVVWLDALRREWCEAVELSCEDVP